MKDKIIRICYLVFYCNILNIRPPSNFGTCTFLLFKKKFWYITHPPKTAIPKNWGHLGRPFFLRVAGCTHVCTKQESCAWACSLRLTKCLTWPDAEVFADVITGFPASPASLLVTSFAHLLVALCWFFYLPMASCIFFFLFQLHLIFKFADQQYYPTKGTSQFRKHAFMKQAFLLYANWRYSSGVRQQWTSRW